MSARCTCLALGLLAACAAVRAGDAWEAMYGRWSGGGEVRGMPAQVELEFRPALDGRGRHLRFVNRMAMPGAKTWTFRAEALYLCDGDGACRGHWYDNRGMVLPLAATAGGGRLLVEWGDASTERGRTAYRLRDDGVLEITDEVLGRDGAWKAFGRTSAARIPEAEAGE